MVTASSLLMDPYDIPVFRDIMTAYVNDVITFDGLSPRLDYIKQKLDNFATIKSHDSLSRTLSRVI